MGERIEKLKTDYKDKEWIGDKRYLLINNSDGTVQIEDRTNYTEKGSDTFFGSKDANNIGKAYNELISTIPNDSSNITIPVSSFEAVQGVAERDFPDGFPYRKWIANKHVNSESIIRVDFSQTAINSGIMSAKGKAGNGGFYIYASENPKFSIVIDLVTVRNQSTVEVIAYATQDELNSLKSTVSKLEEQIKNGTGGTGESGQLFKDSQGYICINYGESD